ncbi:MAG: C45 family autoproteolytic acyltransferase/hydrolase [Candidatus Aenigmatarchaeota archaeon]
MDKKTKFFSFLVVIVLCLTALSVGITDSSQPFVEEQSEDEQAQDEDFPLKGHANTAWMKESEGRKAFVEGTHYEMGYQHGALAGEEVRETIDAFLNSIDEDVEELLDVYENGEPYLQEEYKDEMEGLSHSSNQSLDRVKAIHAAPTLHHCSGFGVHGDATENGSVYHTRSLDYDVMMTDPETGKTMQENSLTIFRDPEEGYASAVPGWSGFIGSVDGINEEKISIGEMGQGTNDTTEEGLFMIFRLRNTLEKSSSMEEAVDLMRPNRTMGFSFIVADGNTNEAQLIEMSQNQFYNGSWDNPQEDNSHQHYQIEDAVRRGNHYVSYQNALTQRDDYTVMPTESAFMHYLNYLEHSRRIEREYGEIDYDTAEDIFKETYQSFPLQFTMHQAVFSPADQSLRVATAYPDGTGAFWNEFHEHSIPEVKEEQDMLNLSNPVHNDTVSGTVEIQPNYTYEPDSIGFYINGSKVGEVDSAPFTYDWDTTSVPNGEHVVEVRADHEDYSAVAYVTVEVDNAGAQEGDAVFNPEREANGFKGEKEYRGSSEVDTPSDENMFGLTSAIEDMRVPSYRYDDPSGLNDWIINETYYMNDTYEVIDGNVSIREGGELIMNNSTLVLNSTFDHEYGLLVSDKGALEMNGSTITNGTGRIYLRAEETASHIKIIDSDISGGGDKMEYPLVRAACNNITVSGSTIVHNSWGLYFEGSSEDPIENVTVTDSTFELKDVAYIPIEGLVYQPSGSSLWIGQSDGALVENVSVEGVNNGKLLSTGVLLFSSANASVRDVHVQNEFIGVGGFGGAHESSFYNLTVEDSHIGVAMLLDAQNNLVEDVHVKNCAAAIGDIYNGEPGNTYKNFNVTDSTVTFLAEETTDVSVEKLTSTNSIGGFLFSTSQGISVVDSYIEGKYVGAVLDECDGFTADNVTFDLTSDKFGIGVEDSAGVTLRDINVKGARWALDVQGDTGAHFNVSVTNFSVDGDELKYYEGEVPGEVSGGQIFIANVQEAEIEAQTVDSPLYLVNSQDVALNVTQQDVVGGVIVDHCSGVEVKGEVGNSSSAGLKVMNSESVQADLDVDGASLAYQLVNSQDVSLKGNATGLNDAVLHTKDSRNIVLDVEAGPSTYGLVSGYSSLVLIGEFPEAEYRRIIQGTSILTYGAQVEAPPDVIETETGTYTYEFEVENTGDLDEDYDLEAEPSDADWLVSAPDQIFVEEGTVETVNVEVSIPDEAEFGDEAEIALTATSRNDTTKTASDSMAVAYEEQLYNLSVQDPEGGVLNVDGTEVSEDETFEYPEGSTVDIEAEADPGYRFVEWTGDVEGIEDTEATSTTITMNDDYSITAAFEELATYTLSVNTEGNGTVEVEPDQEEYEEGTEVTLTAVPAEGWQFSHWEGDVPEDEEENEEIPIIMDTDKDITAHFVSQAEMFELTIDSTEGGNVTEPGEGVFEYEESETVDIEAVAEEGYEFVEWTGDVGTVEDATANATTVEMNDNYTIIAEFKEESVYYELTVNIEGEGEVELEPDQDQYEEGTEVTLSASPEDGWKFVEWTGDHDDTEEEITITMDSNKDITATFEEEEEEPMSIWSILGIVLIIVLIILIAVIFSKRKEPTSDKDLEEELEEELEETEETEELDEGSGEKLEDEGEETEETEEPEEEILEEESEEEEL